MEVIKKDGLREPFDQSKIESAIGAAAREGGIAPEKVEELISKVTAGVMAMAQGKDAVASADIKAKVLSELDSLAPEAAQAWRKYDEAQGRA